MTVSEFTDEEQAPAGDSIDAVMLVCVAITPVWAPVLVHFISQWLG